MTFSSEVKEELAKIPGTEEYCMMAELAGALFMGGRIDLGQNTEHAIELHTEYQSVAGKMYHMITSLFSFEPEMITAITVENEHMSYLLSISEREDAIQLLKAVRLFNDMGYMEEENLMESNPLLQRQDCRRAFLRGAFLFSGSITDPEKNYHFEMVSQSEDKIYQIKDLMNSFGLEPKMVLRKKYHVVYLKEGEMISDMLNILEAHISMMKFENVRILKDVRNSVNRQVNCETANIHKTVSAAVKQIDDIEYIKNTVGLEQLPEALRDIACARLENEEATLKELGEMLNPPVGKSGVNHRLRKLSQLAQTIREKGRM